VGMNLNNREITELLAGLAIGLALGVLIFG
jgi:hypothetical protein